MSRRFRVGFALLALIVTTVAGPLPARAGPPNHGTPHAGPVDPGADPGPSPAAGLNQDASILVYGPTAGGYADTTPGTTVTVWNAATWQTKTTADFAAFDAIVFGDQPICFESPSIWAAAVQNRQAWSAAISGNVIINGTDPDWHGKSLLVHQSVQFAAADPAPGPGLYVSLSCAYHSQHDAVTVELLEGLGQFTAKGVINCPSDAHKVADHPTLAGIDDAYLSGWGCSAHEVFESWPGGFQPLAIIQDATPAPPHVVYTAPDGETGFVYLLARGAAVTCATADDPDGDCLPTDVEIQLGTDPHNPDTDGDGLLDSWEVSGVAGAGIRLPSGISVASDEVFGPSINPWSLAQCFGAVDQTGRITRQYACLNSAPDPLRKDVFLEIDWQDCQVEHACPEVISQNDDPLHHAPNLAALVDLVLAFQAAPVENPDGSTGVRLHILIDEAIPHAPNCDQDASVRRPASFGTVFQRRNAATIEAKQRAVRYVWSGHSSHSDDHEPCPNPGRLDFLKQGIGAAPLADYDYSPFGDANVGGRDILLTLGPLWSCSSKIMTIGHNLGFTGPCFREMWIQGGLQPGGMPFIGPGIFPARIEVPGEGETAWNHPVHRLLGQTESSAIRQLWSRSLMHLLGHALGIPDDATVGNWPSPAGRHQAGPEHPLTALRPESYASWAGLSYAPTGVGVPTFERAPNYRELARTNTDLSDPDNDDVLEHDDNCPGVWNPDQKNTDMGFLGMGINVLEWGDACDPDIDGDGIRNPLPGEGEGLAGHDGLAGGAGYFSALQFDPFPYDTDNDGIDNDDDPDDDNDGVLDAGDVCPLVADPDQGDLDGDGVGDACDLDMDGDGLMNQLEVILGSSPTDPLSMPEYTGLDDSCADGIDNDRDGAIDAADAGCIDGDGDGVANADDNCPNFANPAQIDADRDGVGDACQLLVRIDGVRESLLGAGHAGTELAWSASAAGTYTIRVGGIDCGSGTLIDAGTYDPGPIVDGPTGQPAFAIIESDELVEGVNRIRVCVTSGGSSASAETSVTVDTIAPGMPTVTLAAGSDSGADAGDGVTNVIQPVFEGQAEPLTGVVVSRDGVEVGAVGVDAAGRWRLEVEEPLPAGTSTITAIAVDQIGHVSPASAPFALTIDLTAPESAIVAATAGGLLTFTATDAGGVAEVEIWYRHRPAAGSPFGTWTLATVAPTSPTTFGFPDGAGTYELYSIAVDVAGNREAAPATADLTVTHGVGDATPPTSVAGPLPAVTAAATVAVPFVATDDSSGVAAVELWVRYRVSPAQPWGPWQLALTATASPAVYTFAFGDGRYEFYSIAIDGAGNREAPPAVADTAIHRDAVDDPPDQSVVVFLDTVLQCTPKKGCTPLHIIEGHGLAADDRSAVTAVDYKVYGIQSNGTRKSLTNNWRSATARDGAFNSPVEPFDFSYSPAGGYVGYEVEVRVTAGGSSIRLYPV